MCCGRKNNRATAGKCRSMEIDGGPPPFPGIVEDSYENHYSEDDIEDTSHLPLPSEARSRSITPVNDRVHTPEVVNDDNEKGDTIATALSKEDVSDFQSPQPEPDDDDEWGDFGEAVSAPAPVQNILPPLNMNDDDDDDWGAFDQARPSTDRTESESDPNSARSQEARQLAQQQSFEEWGGFENANESSIQKSVDEDDGWQAEFSSAPAPVNAPSISLEDLKKLEQMLEDDDFWDDGFQEEFNEEEEVVSTDVIDIPSLFDSETLAEMSNGFEEEKQNYSQLWLSLRVVEEAISLKFDWNNSEIRNNHFKSLKIKPIIAKKETRSNAAMFDTSNLLLPTPFQATSSASESAGESSNQKTSSSSPSVESPSVPAVDFDWDTSGLTNPMNRANQSSAIIDVDFLGTNGVASAYTSPLQKDLEQFGLTLENGAKSKQSNGPNILETIMSRANGSNSNSSVSSRHRAPEVLSLDAQKLLERLPDLHYLQSEVLMFPVGTNLPH